MTDTTKEAVEELAQSLFGEPPICAWNCGCAKACHTRDPITCPCSTTAATLRAPDARIVLHSLVSRREYNGAAGAIDGPPTAAGLQPVRLDTGERFSVAPTNLAFIAQSAPAVAPAQAPPAPRRPRSPARLRQEGRGVFSGGGRSSDPVLRFAPVDPGRAVSVRDGSSRAGPGAPRWEESWHAARTTS